MGLNSPFGYAVLAIESTRSVIADAITRRVDSFVANHQVFVRNPLSAQPGLSLRIVCASNRVPGGRSQLAINHGLRLLPINCGWFPKNIHSKVKR